MSAFTITASTTGATSKWTMLVSQLPQHALRRIDVHQLRVLSCLLARFDNYAKAPLDNLQVGRLLLQTASHVHRLSACFGLTPADRSRLRLPLPEIDDDVANWLADNGN